MSVEEDTVLLLSREGNDDHESDSGSGDASGYTTRTFESMISEHTSSSIGCTGDISDIEDCTLDDILREYTPFGFYQKRMLLLLSLSIFVCSPQAAVLVFIGGKSEWSCRQQQQQQSDAPVYEQSFAVTNSSSATVGSTAAPAHATERTAGINPTYLNGDRCALVKNHSCDPVHQNVHGTASAEFNLICENSSEMSYAQSLFFVGMLLGGLLAGWLSDSYGRRTVLLLGQAILTGGSLWTMLSTSFWSLAVSRCLPGCGVMAMVVSLYVLSTESVAPVHRGLVTTLMAVMFGMGFTVLPLVAYLCQGSWRLLMGIGTVCAALSLLCNWLWVGESPCWLLAKGKHDKLETLLSRWIRSTSRLVPIDMMKSLTMSKGKELKSSQLQAGPTALLPLLSKGLRQLTLTLLCLWFTVCLVYYGLALNTNGVGSNKYISFFILSAIEVPALLVLIVILRYQGRRPTLFFCMVATGVSTSLSAFIAWLDSTASADAGRKASIENAQLVVVMCGKFTSAAVFSVVYTYTPELLPTSIRASGLGVCVVISRLGAIVSPFVNSLGRSMPALPYVIFSILAFVSCVGMISWPETKDQGFPETIHDLHERLENRNVRTSK